MEDDPNDNRQSKSEHSHKQTATTAKKMFEPSARNIDFGNLYNKHIINSWIYASATHNIS